MPQDPKTMRAVRATVAAASPPVVTLHPQDASVDDGEAAVFSSSASGADSVQWQLSTDSGSVWSDIGGATSASYTTPTLTASDDGNQYRAAWTNAHGTAYTNAATVTVQASGVSYMWLAESLTPVYHWSN